MTLSTRFAALSAFVLLILPLTDASAFTISDTDDFLLVGRGPSSVSTGVKVSSSNSLGRIYSVPSGANPDVNDNPPWPLPAGATAPVQGIYNDGNIAVTHSSGTYDFSDIDIYADIGVRCVANVTGSCRSGWSNSTLTGGGTFANDSTTMADIETELVSAALEVSSLSATNGWSVSGQGSKNAGTGHWTLDSNGVDGNTTITLAGGLNVIVIDNLGYDMKINNAGLVIDGAADSIAIFLLADESKNWLFDNASITHGTSGIGSDAILFAMLDGGNDTNFNFSKVIVNGAAFWDLSQDGGKLTMNNVQGCGQWVGDHLDFNDVQLARCAFGGTVPEPNTGALLSAAILGLAIASRRVRAFVR